VVGLFVGLSSLFLWYASLYFAQIIVGAAVGQWILGRAHETWGLIGRMAVGIVLLRAGMALPYIGVWLKIAVIVWGVGAISLAVYRRLQPGRGLRKTKFETRNRESIVPLGNER
jgi:hypothetical protein